MSSNGFKKVVLFMVFTFIINLSSASAFTFDYKVKDFDIFTNQTFNKIITEAGGHLSRLTGSYKTLEFLGKTVGFARESYDFLRNSDFSLFDIILDKLNEFFEDNSIENLYEDKEGTYSL
ncbi:MAG: hypothetical protein RR272_05095 [Synergistaceae bacterium]